MADTTPSPAAQATVLDFWGIYSDAPNAFYKSFADEAMARLRERKAAVGALSSRDDWSRYQTEIRQTLRELVGPLPERTPLNARITGTVQKDGYRIEKLVYESQPNFFVTAALFIPANLRGKAPGIIYCSGHTDAGFRGPAYQTACYNLVMQGYVVLAFDPIGQGERLQYFNPKTALSEFGAGSSTREHTRAGSQCFLTGSSLARHMIWDGVRAIDYLVSRPEVDGNRLGITGRSGGGTQSAYLAAIDDRILAAAPENYLTSFEHLLKTRGPQDPEQNFYRGLAARFDQTDLVLARAPKPMLIIATTRDIFSIEGTQVLHDEAKRAYQAYGQPEALTMTVDDAEHVSTLKNRQAMYAFFSKHLKHSADLIDRPNPQLSAEDLRVTETGQVATSLQGESVFTLNRREAQRLQRELEERRRDLAAHLDAVKRAARRLSGEAPAELNPQAVVFSGRTARDGYAVEKYLLPVDERYAIPVLAFAPANKSTGARVVLYLHPGGKAAEAAPGGEIEALVRQGHTVIAPDVLGSGELGPGFLGVPGDNPPRLWYGYVLLGKSMIGRQLADVARVTRFAEARFGVRRGELCGLARGALGPLLLHAAALEKDFGRIALVEGLISYRSIVETERYRPAYIAGAVPAALTAYDLPDLVACAAPRPVWWIAPRTANGAAAPAAELEADFAVAKRVSPAPGAEWLQLVAVEGKEQIGRSLAEWLK